MTRTHHHCFLVPGPPVDHALIPDLGRIRRPAYLCLLSRSLICDLYFTRRVPVTHSFLSVFRIVLSSPNPFFLYRPPVSLLYLDLLELLRLVLASHSLLELLPYLPLASCCRSASRLCPHETSIIPKHPVDFTSSTASLCIISHLHNTTIRQSLVSQNCCPVTPFTPVSFHSSNIEIPAIPPCPIPQNSIAFQTYFNQQFRNETSRSKPIRYVMESYFEDSRASKVVSKSGD